MWTDQVWASPLDIRRRVFCNRSLNMKSISAIGVSPRQQQPARLSRTWQKARTRRPWRARDGQLLLACRTCS